MSNCKLCGNNALLQESHIIPSFVAKWLKDTSITGYLRQAINPNLRQEDITKIRLLCRDCENMFSVYESSFAREIFYPYVNQELDDWGIPRGKIRSFVYQEWLLKFVVSVQWRALLTDDSLCDINLISESMQEKYKTEVSFALENWKNYLLDNTHNSGDERHYIIFLRNLVGGRGFLPDRIHDKVNTYLLRSIDTTLAYSQNTLFLFTKLGPLVIISGIKPKEISDMSHFRIKKQGVIRTMNHIMNKNVTEFIFITRPKEAFNGYTLSERQQEIISRDTDRKIETATNYHSLLATFSDYLLKKRNG